ncbi:sulfurtransferase [Gordonia sp. CPCC 206044]|uniref:sulfurtransferase n=1 Tax=Gordonia sp. CPCC 206044 TaxID=3140793 RepID=UPI003AF408F2
MTDTALVSVEWLDEHLSSVVLLDTSIRRGSVGELPFSNGREGFERGHIPGARFADMFTELSDPTAVARFMRPSESQFVSVARALGIDDDAHVVVYDSLNGAWAARAWWVLRSFGLSSVQVLDGGLSAWRAAGLPVGTGPGVDAPASGALTVIDRSDLVVGIDDVLELVGAQTDSGRPLVCGLRAEEFRGDPDDPQSGHIPGSLNLPYADTLDEAGRVSRTRTRRLAAELGLSTRRAPVLYCGGAVNAAGVALALHQIGIDDVGVYDGSLSEWRLDPRRPLQQTPKEDGR